MDMRWLHLGRIQANPITFFFSELEPGDTAVIKEIYDSENAQEIFEIELERALQVRNKSRTYNENELKHYSIDYLATSPEVDSLKKISSDIAKSGHEC